MGPDHLHQEPHRLLQADVAKEFLAQVVAQARQRVLTSDERFTVDGTLLEARASVKSFHACGIESIHSSQSHPTTGPSLYLPTVSIYLIYLSLFQLNDKIARVLEVALRRIRLPK